MKSIYIAGGAGMLGSAFYSVCKETYLLKCTDANPNEMWVTYLDFVNKNAYWNDVKDFDPDYLFHIGAYTDIEFCEENVGVAYAVNFISVKTAVDIANSLNIPLVFISTSTVFDGNKEVYEDMDDARPITVYGETKRLAEEYVQAHANKYLICRAGWMFGGWHKDKKFIGKIKKLIDGGAKEIYAVNDTYGSPTYTHDFVNNVLLLLRNDVTGTFNMVNHGSASRYDMANEYVKLTNADVKIIPVDSSFFYKDYYALRPVSEVLVNTKLNAIGLNCMRNWRLALKEYVEQF